MRERRHVKSRSRKSRRYHRVDDDASIFEYELPDWLVGAD